MFREGIKLRHIITNEINNPWEIIQRPYALFGNSALISKKIFVLHQITNNHSPSSVLPHLLPLLFRNEYQLVKENPLVKKEVVTSIHILMKKMLKSHNHVISHEFADRFRFINITVSNVSVLSSLSSFEHSGVLLGIASLNMNGYVREAALDLVGNLYEDLSLLLPFLLARLNDHVEIIREKANKYLEIILLRCSLEDILCSCDAFTHCAKTMRTESIILQQKAFHSIRKTPSITLIDSLKQWPTQAQIFILKSLFDEIEQENVLLEHVLDHANPSARQWLIKSTCA